MIWVCKSLSTSRWLREMRLTIRTWRVRSPPHQVESGHKLYRKVQRTIFVFVTDFYICTLIVDVTAKNNHLRIICNNFQEILSESKEITLTETNNGLNQHLLMSSFPLIVHFGQRNLHLCTCIAFSQKDKIAVRTRFNFKCITKYTVKFLYQGHDVFVILLTECTEFL